MTLAFPSQNTGNMPIIKSVILALVSRRAHVPVAMTEVSRARTEI